MGKVWPALDIHIPACDPELLDLVLADLDDFHPTAIQDPDGTTPLRVFFTTAGDRDAAAQAIGRAFARGVFIAPIDIGDEDWATRSQAQLRAITVGRIVVAPPWDTYKTGKWGRVQFSEDTTENCTRPHFGSDNTVVIQPSMGFGTGHHATTRLVLKALQDLPLEGRAVLDIGCGSGVLAIAAVKLGARAAVAVDIDPDALDNARENAALNDIGDRIRFELGDYRQMSLRAEIVMANLTGGLLERSAEVLAAAVAPGGWLIVSGLMEHERAAVVLALEQFLALKTIAQEAEWMCASFRRGEAL